MPLRSSKIQRYVAGWLGAARGWLDSPAPGMAPYAVGATGALTARCAQGQPGQLCTDLVLGILSENDAIMNAVLEVRSSLSRGEQLT
jgi:hypothetical protein